MERAGLKHDAEPAQGRARLARDIMPENADPARSDRIETRDQRKQRRFAGAIQSQQDGKGRLPDSEADIVQRDPCTVAMADAVDLKGGDLSDVEWLHYHSRKRRADPHGGQTDPAQPRPSCRRPPMKMPT